MSPAYRHRVTGQTQAAPKGSKRDAILAASEDWEPDKPPAPKAEPKAKSEPAKGSSKS